MSHEVRIERYIIRYFVPTIFGAGMIALIVFSENSQLKPAVGSLLSPIADLAKVNVNVTSGVVFLLLSAGLTFGYLASTPVLVMHTLRYKEE